MLWKCMLKSKVKKLILKLKEEMESSDKFMKNMAFKMYEKFSKYWSEYSMILAMAVVLDPRYKLQYVEFTYKKLYGSSFAVHSDRLREKLHDLFSEYITEPLMFSRTSTVPAAATRDTSKVVHENKDTVLTKSMRDMLKVRTFFFEESITVITS